jgi:hypothetical protein
LPRLVLNSASLVDRIYRCEPLVTGLFYFIFELMYIKITREIYCDNSIHMYSIP